MGGLYLQLDTKSGYVRIVSMSTIDQIELGEEDSVLFIEMSVEGGVTVSMVLPEEAAENDLSDAQMVGLGLMHLLDKYGAEYLVCLAQNQGELDA